MSFVVGSVAVSQCRSVAVSTLDVNDISPHDVQACVFQQYGSELSIWHNRFTDNNEFIAADANTLPPRPDCTPTLALRGQGRTVTVALPSPFDPSYFMHDAAPQTKVVPPRSKKLLLT